MAGSAGPIPSSWEPQRAQEATRRGQVWGCAQGLAEAGSEKALGHGRSPALNGWGTSDQPMTQPFQTPPVNWVDDLSPEGPLSLSRALESYSNRGAGLGVDREV